LELGNCKLICHDRGIEKWISESHAKPAGKTRNELCVIGIAVVMSSIYGLTIDLSSTVVPIASIDMAHFQFLCIASSLLLLLAPTWAGLIAQPSISYAADEHAVAHTQQNVVRSETDTETGVLKAELEFRPMENQLNIYKHVEIQAIRIFIYLMILVLTAI